MFWVSLIRLAQARPTAVLRNRAEGVHTKRFRCFRAEQLELGPNGIRDFLRRLKRAFLLSSTCIVNNLTYRDATSFTQVRRKVLARTWATTYGLAPRRLRQLSLTVKSHRGKKIILFVIKRKFPPVSIHLVVLAYRVRFLKIRSMSPNYRLQCLCCSGGGGH